MSIPYVVSEDIHLLLEKWAREKGFILPPQQFFDELRRDFSEFMRRMFTGFEFVGEAEITEGLNRIIFSLGLATVSLDEAYFPAQLTIKVARLVDEQGKDRGIGRRAGSDPVLKQIRQLRESNTREVVLVDDVVYSGVSISRVIDLLNRAGIRVPVVCIGIAIAEGRNKLADMGCETRYVRLYNGVIDELCERDFYPGVPLSGRLLNTGENIGVPYIFPFGRPGEWASIPSKFQLSFSRFCLSQTIALFEEIEKCSSRVVRCGDLSRQVKGLEGPSSRFVDLLSDLL